MMPPPAMAVAATVVGAPVGPTAPVGPETAVTDAAPAPEAATRVPHGTTPGPGPDGPRRADLVALELHLMQRATGMALESPAVRP